MAIRTTNDNLTDRLAETHAYTVKKAGIKRDITSSVGVLSVKACSERQADN